MNGDPGISEVAKDGSGAKRSRRSVGIATESNHFDPGNIDIVHDIDPSSVGRERLEKMADIGVAVRIPAAQCVVKDDPNAHCAVDLVRIERDATQIALQRRAVVDINDGRDERAGGAWKAAMDARGAVKQSEERRVGIEVVGRCKYGWSQYN